MSDEIVKVEDGAVTLALGRFQLSLAQRAELLKTIAAGQLASIRRTFREQGSPAGSWAPLSPATLRNSKSKATAGRKILILSGRLLNSIQAQGVDNGIVLGTNLPYARVQQEGSLDYSGSPNGPQAKIAGRGITIGRSSRKFQAAIHYGLREVTGSDGKQHYVPVATRTGMHKVFDKRGRTTTVRAAYLGPLENERTVKVSEHERYQNIPARPYLVIRPEDPGRIADSVMTFVGRCAAQAGLQTGGAV